MSPGLFQEAGGSEVQGKRLHARLASALRFPTAELKLAFDPTG